MSLPFNTSWMSKLHFCILVRFTGWAGGGGADNEASDPGLTWFPEGEEWSCWGPIALGGAPGTAEACGRGLFLDFRLLFLNCAGEKSSFVGASGVSMSKSSTS